MKLHFSTNTAIAFFLTMPVLLSALSYLGVVCVRILGVDQFVAYNEIFNTGLERNLPTLYATVTLFLCGVLMALIGKHHAVEGAPYRRHWQVLSVVFVILALDEYLMLHERVSHGIEESFHTTGYFNYGWVLVWGPVTLVSFLLFLPFVLHLPKRIAALMVSAFVLYVTGAVGLEMVGANYHWNYGMDNFVYDSIAHVEEFLEMAGVGLLLCALIRYAQDSMGSLQVLFHAEPQPNMATNIFGETTDKVEPSVRGARPAHRS